MDPCLVHKNLKKLRLFTAIRIQHTLMNSCRLPRHDRRGCGRDRSHHAHTSISRRQQRPISSAAFFEMPHQYTGTKSMKFFFNFMLFKQRAIGGEQPPTQFDGLFVTIYAIYSTSRINFSDHLFNLNCSSASPWSPVTGSFLRKGECVGKPGYQSRKKILDYLSFK